MDRFRAHAAMTMNLEFGPGPGSAWVDLAFSLSRSTRAAATMHQKMAYASDATWAFQNDRPRSRSLSSAPAAASTNLPRTYVLNLDELPIASDRWAEFRWISASDARPPA